MIFASPKNKGFAVRPADAADMEAANSVEQTLREAAAWEPHCPPPAAFAAFTIRALENRTRNPLPPANRRPGPSSVQWVRGLRAPLAASLALGLVLWVGGSANDLNRLSVPDQTRETSRETARPFTDEKPAAPIHDSRTAEQSGSLVQTPQKADAIVRPVLTDSVSASRSRSARRNQYARGRRHKRPAEELFATQNANQSNSVPLWKTETVERPAWGALIPATFACTTPASNDAGQESGETETTLMPVVLDVALPDTRDFTATSSTDAPLPQSSPAP